MLRLVPLAILALSPLSAAAGPQSPRAGAIVVGSDPLAAGSLQRAIDRRLSAIAGVETRDAPALAAVVGRPTGPPAVDLALKKKVADLLEQVAKAYYDARMNDALARLGDVDAAMGGPAAIPAADRAKVLLWRAAVGLHEKDRDGAEDAARSALAIDPGLVVDLKVYPPSVKELTDAIRALGSKTALVTLRGLPPGAAARVDDRPVGATGIRLAAGRHTLVASAPGFLPVTAPFDVDADLELEVAMPIAIDPKVADALAWALSRGAVEAADGTRLDRLAAAARLDTLVIAAELPGQKGPAMERALVWQGGEAALSDLEPATADGEKALLDWIAARIGVRAPSASASPPP